MAMSGRPVVDFFFSSASPWSYLAFLRLRETAMRTGTAIAFRPVVAASLESATRTTTAPTAAATAYAAKDLQDWSLFCGASLAQPAPPAVDETLAQLAILAANKLGQARQYCGAVLRARHSQGRDIASRTLLEELAAGCGLPADEFATGMDSPDVVAELRGNALELQQRGGFTTPTMIAGNELFVGHDRMPLLEMALVRASDRPFVAPGEHDRG